MLTPAPAAQALPAPVDVAAVNDDGVPPKLTRIGAGLILLLGALTAVGPFTIDLYLAAFPQITSDMDTQPAARARQKSNEVCATGANDLRCSGHGPCRASAARCSGVPYPLL